MPERRWHHLPFMTHCYCAGQALLMASQSRSCTEYLLQMDNIIVLVYYFNLTKKSTLVSRL